ncbi:MAG: exo-alpha-sialidase [Bacteroidaceae bacterium]|nr:exo-alpha-sialidase [Bacteroidaceae bacterium]
MLTKRFNLFLLAALLAIPSTLSAQRAYKGTPTRLFTTYDSYGVPYRIPAITTTCKGSLIAVADRRYCGFDIGFGQIDLVARTSKNNGRTWSADTVIQRGSGIQGSDDCGYGDAALVADRTSKRVLCMSVTGSTPYIKGTRARPNRVARWYSPDGGRSWTKAEDVTDALYDLLPNTRTMFIGSGRIMQSRVVKKGNYFRLYCSVLTRTQMDDRDVACNYVIYSDDFGQTWGVLGGSTLDGHDSPCIDGDEPKAEELPNGDVVLSSRKWYGRFFNIFRFADIRANQERGSWGTCVASDQVPGGIKVGANSCNGEIMLIDATNVATGKAAKLMLQSLPCGEGRTDVGIWFKEIIPNGIYSPRAFAHAWTRGLQVSDTTSAYSTMSVQKDGRIAFFYEEEAKDNGYSMVYVPLTIEEITLGRYK